MGIKSVNKTPDGYWIVIRFCVILVFFSACRDNHNEAMREEERQEGIFQVILAPLNSIASGTPYGTGRFSIKEDEFRAQLTLLGGGAVNHLQFITGVSTCPDINSDLNKDGYIDILEAIDTTGGVLIPLDSDLSSQLAGGVFPLGPVYNYDERSSFSEMLFDLKLSDPNVSDLYIKLSPLDEFYLEGRVVLIHGVPASVNLPPTVEGLSDFSAQEALPILCGVITLVSPRGV